MSPVGGGRTPFFLWYHRPIWVFLSSDAAENLVACGVVSTCVYSLSYFVSLHMTGSIIFSESFIWEYNQHIPSHWRDLYLEMTCKMMRALENSKVADSLFEKMSISDSETGWHSLINQHGVYSPKAFIHSSKTLFLLKGYYQDAPHLLYLDSTDLNSNVNNGCLRDNLFGLRTCMLWKVSEQNRKSNYCRRNGLREQLMI